MMWNCFDTIPCELIQAGDLLVYSPGIVHVTHTRKSRMGWTSRRNVVAARQCGHHTRVIVYHGEKLVYHPGIFDGICNNCIYHKV